MNSGNWLMNPDSRICLEGPVYFLGPGRPADRSRMVAKGPANWDRRGERIGWPPKFRDVLVESPKIRSQLASLATYSRGRRQRTGSSFS